MIGHASRVGLNCYTPAIWLAERTHSSGTELWRRGLALRSGDGLVRVSAFALVATFAFLPNLLGLRIARWDHTRTGKECLLNENILDVFLAVKQTGTVPGQ